MTDIQIFKNEDFGEVRTTVLNGEPWFAGKDVAAALGYKNPQEAVRTHVDEEDRTVSESLTVNGTAIALINEAGLYSLILSSKLPAAKKFKRWVTHEVLPSIRKQGYYSLIPNDQLLNMLSDRLKENPKLLSDTRFSARDKQSFKVYEMEEQIGQLWEKRFTYCGNDYNRELALICNDSIHRYNQEWRRYVRWKVAYDKHQKEAQLCFQSERRSIDRDTRSDNRIKFSDLDEPRGGIKLSPFPFPPEK